MNLLTLSYSGSLAVADIQLFKEMLAPVADRLNAEAMVLGDGVQATLTHDPSALHARLDRLCDAIEALVAVAAASLPDEPPEPPDDGFPQPLSRPR